MKASEWDEKGVGGMTTHDETFEALAKGKKAADWMEATDMNRSEEALSDLLQAFRAILAHPPDGGLRELLAAVIQRLRDDAVLWRLMPDDAVVTLFSNGIAALAGERQEEKE